MSDEHDSALRMAVAEGLLSREEAESLKAEAALLARNPLELLVERGRLSADTLASLRREAQHEPGRDTGEPPDDATLNVPPRGERGAEFPGFPVSGWKRYECLRLLGQGGMGRVFLAHDTQLRRDVALKFVRDDDPDHMRRFISEARAQARVTHERVCQVFEVGEVQGRTYIAMQYIDGAPLSQLARELTLEQKILVMREVAEGVHAAHRAGLIHRDIKPSNIMVERTDSGVLKPYVVDFGLARDWKEGMTATGSVMGTPHYMAPEQARGEVSRLDRRADVYSLGATLYHLLTGVLPIPGSNSLEVLNNISTVEPRAPRSVDKDIPADLEAIILKCMEKERSARYDSARALSEELERFLNGEPVLARAPGLWYRLRKRARKHKSVVAVASAALVLLVLSLGWAGLALRQTERRAALELRAQELETSIEDLARHPYLLPLHDTSAERERIRAWMRELEVGLSEEGLDTAVSHYVLGRGHQALGEEEKALASLKAAWEGGYRQPRVAYALVLVLGHLHQEQLLELEGAYRQRRGKGDFNGSTFEQQHEARRQELQRLYRDPALPYLEYLKRSPQAPVPPQYVEALLAFNESRFGDALARLQELGGRPLGFYAALKLAGDIHLASAVQHWNQGRPEQARADFDASRQAYVRAADIGRSDPSLHHALARLESAVVDMEVYNRREVELPLERGLQALERTLTAAPDAYAYEARVLQARLFRRLAEFRAHQSKGKDVQEPVEKAREAAEAARKLAPERPEAWMELARSYWRLGRNLQARQEDPSEKLRDSLAALEHLAPKDHNYEFHLLRGLIFKTWSEYEELSGLDSLPRLDLAIESYRKAIQLNEERPSAWLNLAYASLLHSTWGNSPDPAGDLEQARLALAKVRALNPHYILLSEYEANYHEQLARWTRAQGGDARPHWEKALALYEQGLTLDGESESLLNGRGHVLVQLGQEAWDRGGDPFPWFARAEASYEKASRVAPERFLAHSNLGATNARRAMYQLARGENPTPSLLASVEAYQRAISRAQEHVNPRTYLGRSLQLLAAFELEQGRDPRKSLARASDALHQALSRNATSAEALAQLAQVRSLEARWKARQGQARSEDFEATAAAFQRALHQDPKNQDLRLAFGRFHLGQAAWKKELGQEPLASLEQGLALARELLTERPLWADALLLRASLELTRMEVAARPEPQVLDQARKDIDRALASNRNLEREARQQLSRLRKLLARAR